MCLYGSESLGENERLGEEVGETDALILAVARGRTGASG